jgi:hypothetical protein
MPKQHTNTLVCSGAPWVSSFSTRCNNANSCTLSQRWEISRGCLHMWSCVVRRNVCFVFYPHALPPATRKCGFIQFTFPKPLPDPNVCACVCVCVCKRARAFGCVRARARLRMTRKFILKYGLSTVCRPTRHLKALNVSVPSNHNQAPLWHKFKKHKYIWQYAIFGFREISLICDYILI